MKTYNNNNNNNNNNDNNNNYVTLELSHRQILMLRYSS